MKKHYLLLPALLLLASCGGQASSISRVIHSSEIPSSSEPSQPSSELPSESSSGEESIPSSSSEAKPAADLSPAEYAQFPKLYLERLAQYKSYKAITTGKTTADIGMMKTDQSIDVTTIKGEYSYLKNVSNSTFVNTFHEAFFHQDKAMYRDGEKDQFAVNGKDVYLDKYGVDPFSYCIEGYEVGEGCITEVKRVLGGEGYTYVLTFDVEKATPNVRIQMKQFGGLKDYPVFSSIVITCQVQEDFTPIKLHVDAAYKATKNFLFDINTDCVQTYDVTFSQFDETIEVPHLSEAQEKI